jgi:hypothetical protein
MSTPDTPVDYYRRRWGTAVWHSSPRCPHWPATLDCEERTSMPLNGSICAECATLSADTADRRASQPESIIGQKPTAKSAEV